MSLRPQRGKYISKRQRIFYDKYNCHKLGALANPGIRREKEEIIKQLPTLCNFLSSIHTISRVKNIVHWPFCSIYCKPFHDESLNLL